jgi:hypothetical protein
MATAADVRKFALVLDGVREVDHWGRPAFRTAKRIFAVMRPDGLFLHLTEERKQFLFEAAPDVFVKFMWGKTANVIVQIAGVSPSELQALIREAWQHAAPSTRRNPARRQSARDDAPRRRQSKKRNIGEL